MDANKKKIMMGAGAGLAVLAIIILIWYFVFSGPAETEYLGCYNDKDGDRVFTHQTPEFVTFAELEAVAKAANSPYFGFQYVSPESGKGEGWFGATVTEERAKRHGVATSCKLVNGQQSGGSWTFALYKTGGI